jgi:hypothetical protein
MTFVLIPGRHHLMTEFQHSYLETIVKNGLQSIPDINGQPLAMKEPLEGIIFAVTSANHAGTRRNPLPLYQRAMAIQEFSSDIDTPAFIYDIDDVGNTQRFAEYTLKRIAHKSDSRHVLNPTNTVVVCSTPVLEMYEKLGFKILPAELKSRENGKYVHHEMLPWEIIEEMARAKGEWKEEKTFLAKAHKSSRRLFITYGLGEQIRMLFNDKILGNDGDITDTRDYNTYVREMDTIAELKFAETSQHIRPGRIGDIGCAVGSWIKLAAADARFRESDFFGIEVARRLYDRCEQRKAEWDFGTDYVFFSRKNAVTSRCFSANSMNTIHTSSLTHEIESYGGRNDLKAFLKNRLEELVHEGIWINRDVVGPEDGNKLVYMQLNTDDGSNIGWNFMFSDKKKRAEILSKMSTYGRFLRFAKDFRKDENYMLKYKEVTIDGNLYVRLMLRDACEFMSKKDYTDNWDSEMHETFCFWSFSEWKKAMADAGFSILPESRAYTNPWIVENRYKGKVQLFDMKDNVLVPLDYPVTNMLMLGVKR